jgi:hypothetical protein
MGANLEYARKTPKKGSAKKKADRIDEDLESVGSTINGDSPITVYSDSPHPSFINDEEEEEVLSESESSGDEESMRGSVKRMREEIDDLKADVAKLHEKLAETLLLTLKASRSKK